MSKFFYFLNLISLIFFSKQQENYIDKFYNENYSDPPEPDDCLCNTNRKACNYLCCCDEKCSEDTIKQWRERSKCIDEKDTVGIFSDRCIEQHLIVFYNKRRGLKKEEATEDVSNSNKMIKNYCFSMDNSKTMSRDIETVNFVTPDSISDDGTSSGLSDTQDKDYLTINTENNIFITNGHFSLYSGADCTHSSEVEKFTNENYTCYMRRDRDINEHIRTLINNNNIQIGGSTCQLNRVYTIDGEGLLHYVQETNKQIGEDDYIVEIEFIIIMSDYNDENLECFINAVKSKINGDNFIFKNSVIFTGKQETQNIPYIPYIPYRYSGTNGYYNGYPLKITNSDNSIVFNDYYIVGKYSNGSCRMNENNDDINNYLYNNDKPILFNQNVVYFCTLGDDGNIFDATLFKKIDAIGRIAKYGDSNFRQKNDPDYWVEIDKTKLDPSVRDNTNIQMNIYLGTKKIGVHSFKYIYKVILKNIKGERNRLSLDVKYIDLDKTSEHEEKPNYPAFIPSLPADLLDPIIYSRVDK